jgi:hypothetical protein
MFMLVQFAGLSLFSQSSHNTAFDESKEQEAIKATLRRETDCYMKADFDCWKDCHSQKAAMGIVYWDGLWERNGWKELEEYTKKDFQAFKENPNNTPPAIEWDNFQFYFMGDKHVLVWYEQYSTQADKSCIFSREVRVMEKEEGKWRIVLMNAIYDPKKPCR